MGDVDFDSPSVQSYLAILQNVISRMASNSAACKTWSIALVSAVIVIVSDKGKPDYVWISIVPIVLLYLLDSYYLGLERSFRDLYNEFIRKLHTGKASIEDVFIVIPASGTGALLRATAEAAGSISILPFYGLLGGMLVAVRIWIL